MAEAPPTRGSLLVRLRDAADGPAWRQFVEIYAPLIFGFFAVDAAFRAGGDTRTPFVLLATSVAVTLVLDPALILGWGPLPRWSDGLRRWPRTR